MYLNELTSWQHQTAMIHLITASDVASIAHSSVSCVSIFNLTQQLKLQSKLATVIRLKKLIKKSNLYL